MDWVLNIVVYGEPQPAGSKTAAPIYRKNRFTGKPEPVLNKQGRVMTTVRDDNPKSKPWKQEVAKAVLSQYDGDLLDCPLHLEIDFIKPRPQNHFGTGKNKGRIKQSANAYPITKPDATKLLRAVEDAMQGICYTNDSRIVSTTITKQYGPRLETHIRIARLPATVEDSCDVL